MQQAIPRPRAHTPGGVLTREVLVPLGFILAIFSTNLLLGGLPNVKLFDLLVFVAAYSLGFRRGAVVAAGAWLLYDQANPWGYASPMLLAAKIGAEIAYVAAGSLTRRFVSPQSIRLGPSKATIAFVASALVATAAYDVATNAYTGLFWASIAGGSDYFRWLGVAMFGPGAAFFMLLHVGSNVALFPVFGPLLIKGTERAKRSLNWE